MTGSVIFPFAQIAADRLPERVLLDREVQQIVDELKGHADVQPVVPERVFLFDVRAGPSMPPMRALPRTSTPSCADDLEVLVLGEIDDAVLR
jgi:hypothetical protein